MKIKPFNVNDMPCMFSHPRNVDWTARVEELSQDMTHSDASSVADLEYRKDELPVYAPDSPWRIKAEQTIKALKEDEGSL